MRYDINLKEKNGGYGKIGRRYGLNWIEPWYGNLPSERSLRILVQWLMMVFLN